MQSCGRLRGGVLERQEGDYRGKGGNREGQSLTKLTAPMWVLQHMDTWHHQILPPRQVCLGFQVQWEQYQAK